MNRNQMIKQMEGVPEWDICIIGGGATGLGIAVDAASRGLKTILFERADLAQGTSSRSTKLIHGGVRYLRQGRASLVKDALRERGLLLKNAPHVVHNLSFVIPTYHWWEKPYYGWGLKLYDLLSGQLGIGNAAILSRKTIREISPALKEKGLRGGVLYHDGQFDDSRLAIHLAQTAVQHHAVTLNYFPVTGFIKSKEKAIGVTVKDDLTGTEYQVKSRVIINATGVFADEVLAMDEKNHVPMLQPSQGIHIVLSREFLPGETAMMIPRTSDGRVLFALPWHGSIVLGTTDTPVSRVTAEPLPMKKEIDFLLQDASRYLRVCPAMQDIRSIFAGLRPLVKGNRKRTAALSRDHIISIGPSGMITITGGKWTTYRKMAEEVVNLAIQKKGMHAGSCRTATLPIAGQGEDAIPAHLDDCQDQEIEKAVIHAVNHEMCMTVEDFLSRRTRQLILDAQKAIGLAPQVASLMRKVTGKDEVWERRQIHNFNDRARTYLPGHYQN